MTEGKGLLEAGVWLPCPEVVESQQLQMEKLLMGGGREFEQASYPVVGIQWCSACN